jgi:O-antigen/teichoic acid export membrane protein
MSVRRAAIWAIAAQYASFIVQFLVSVVISRFFLQPDEVGLFSVAMAAAMLVAIFQDFGLTRYIGGQAELTERDIEACSAVALLGGLSVTAIIIALAYPLSLFYAQPGLFALLVIVGLSYLFVPFSIVPVALLTREMAFRRLFMVNVGSALASGTTAIALAAAGFSSFALAWATIVLMASRMVIAQFCRPVRPPIPPRIRGAGEVVRFGSTASVLYLCGAAGVRSPDLIVGRILSMSAVGLYTRASGLADQLRALLSGAIGSVMFPAFARIRDSGQPLAPPYLKVVSGFSALVWPAMAGLSAGSEPLIRALYGERWIAVAPLLRWIAIAEMCFIALPLHMEVPIVMGRIKTLLRYNLLDTLASIGLLVVAAFWGLDWAAASRVGYGLAWIAIYAAFMQRIIAFDWRDMITIYAKSGLATLAAIAPLLVGYRFWAGPQEMNFLELAILSAFGVVTWLAALFIVRHPVCDEVRPILSRALTKLRIRRA